MSKLRENPYGENETKNDSYHESRLMKVTYREIIRWVAFIALFGLSVWTFLKSGPGVRTIYSNPDYKRETLFGVVLAFIAILLFTVTFFILAYATPGVFKSLLKNKTKRLSHVPDPNRAQRVLGNIICFVFAILFITILVVAGVEGRYAGMNYLGMWGRFILVLFSLALWNEFYLSNILFTKTNFFNNWVKMASGTAPQTEYHEAQWTNRKRKNFILTPIDSLLLALIFWFVI